MKKTYQKKLSEFIVAAMMFSASAKAQIVYTDVPDTTINSSGGVYSLDLNNDGITDFQISHTVSITNFCGTATNHFISIKPMNANKVAGDSIDFLSPYSFFQKIFAAKKISLNKKINSGMQTWSADTNLRLASKGGYCVNGHTGYHVVYYTNGIWAGAVDGYLALKLQVGPHIYFGWVRLDISSSSNSFTVKDYAYKNSAGAMILAGQNTTQYITISAATGSPFCAGNTVNVSYVKYGNFNTTNIFSAELSDSAGSFSNPLIIGSLNSNVSGTINTAIPLNSISGSKYRIRIRSSSPSRISADNGSDIVINTSPPKSAISANGSTTFCSGLSVKLSVSQGSGFSYQWEKNGTNILNSTAYKYTANSSGNFTCHITNGCGSVNSNSISVNELPLPIAQITPQSSPTVCSGPIILNANSGAGLSYQWFQSYDCSNPNYYNNTGATGISYSVTSFTLGSCASVKVTGSNGCSKFSPSIHLAVGNPYAAIITNDSTTFCAGDSAVLKNYDGGYGFGPYYTYQWKRNNIDIAGATNSSFPATQSGTYTLKITNPNGNCFSVSPGKVITVPCRLSNEYSFETSEQLAIYPNPATNTITIKFPPDSDRDDEEGTIQIVNHFGQIVETLNYVSLLEMQIDVSKFRAGMYVVRWSSGENSETKKLSVIK